uniref:Uncharacterized protein n=1 Tax=Utricularia reniformis TaxID=192314 RepID=A0A1Y0B1L2_9LAMI|nr:hypothetical protein AEK19_MT1017 [Utricularia reniformis]ART31239.1 hypothetical protein AEK19_MT1017 [Utricularia reniformis]
MPSRSYAIYFYKADLRLLCYFCTFSPYLIARGNDYLN